MGPNRSGEDALSNGQGVSRGDTHLVAAPTGLGLRVGARGGARACSHPHECSGGHGDRGKKGCLEKVFEDFTDPLPPDPESQSPSIVESWNSLLLKISQQEWGQ